MNINAAMAAIEVLLDESADFQAWWVEIGIDRRIDILEEMQLKIEREIS